MRKKGLSVLAILFCLRSNRFLTGVFYKRDLTPSIPKKEEKNRPYGVCVKCIFFFRRSSLFLKTLDAYLTEPVVHRIASISTCDDAIEFCIVYFNKKRIAKTDNPFFNITLGRLVSDYDFTCILDSSF
jgi:hypothetical protein